MSVVALFLKAKIFHDQLMRRRSQFVLEDEEKHGRSAKLQKHKKRLIKAKRRILLVYSSMLVGLAE